MDLACEIGALREPFQQGRPATLAAIGPSGFEQGIGLAFIFAWGTEASEAAHAIAEHALRLHECVVGINSGAIFGRPLWERL